MELFILPEVEDVEGLQQDHNEEGKQHPVEDILPVLDLLIAFVQKSFPVCRLYTCHRCRCEDWYKKQLQFLLYRVNKHLDLHLLERKFQHHNVILLPPKTYIVAEGFHMDREDRDWAGDHEDH